MTSQRNAEVVIYPRRRGPGPFLRCARIPAAELLLEVHSTIFNAPYWWMRSTVAVLPSEALAAAYVSALGSSRGRRCLFAGFPGQVHVTVDALAAPSRIVAFRVTQNTGVAQPTRTDVFAFASGRALVTLTAQGEKTPPLTIERRLASRLYGRAITHKL